jgi:hypothetical protein
MIGLNPVVSLTLDHRLMALIPPGSVLAKKSALIRYGADAAEHGLLAC